MSKKPKIIAKQIDVTIERCGQKGDGLGYYQNETVYIDGALIGEQVNVTLERGNDQNLRGKVTSPEQVIVPSDNRHDPECRHAWRCGGCSLQHMGVDFYRKWKIEQVQEAFTRAEEYAQKHKNDPVKLNNSDPDDWDSPDDDWGAAPANDSAASMENIKNAYKPKTQHDPIFIGDHTRRRASFSALKQHNKLTLGFREKRSHTILDIDDCLVLRNDLFKIVQDMRPFLMGILRDSRTCGLFVQMTDSGLDVVLSGEIGAKGEPDLSVHQGVADMIQALPIARISWRKRERESLTLLLEARPLLHNFGALSVQLPSMAFLQPSIEGEQALTNAMRRGIDAFVAERTKKQSKNSPKSKAPLMIADLFAGCGTLSGVLLDYGIVHGYESDQDAVQALDTGLRKANEASYARRSDLFKDPLMAGELTAYDIIVMDPPRAGAKAQSESLASAHSKADKPQLLVYMSCNPASFIRDAGVLAAGGWRFESLQVIDQFIWSSHVELCGVFRRNV